MTKPEDTITPGERRELRAVVRQQMKVLRAEVAQRDIELQAEVEARLVERYRDEDRRNDELNRTIADIQTEANRQLRDALTTFEDLADGGTWRRVSGFQAPYLSRSEGNRRQLRDALLAGVKVQVKQAMLALDRQEADLLRELAIDGLETAAARSFLDRIPSVAELVPARRMHEIEAEFDQQKGLT
jgi:AcrR family transcriptional regulator